MHLIMKRFLRTLFQLGLLLFVPASWATSPMQTDVRALVAIVQDCVNREDSDYPVFHGCVDWHSAVHGHWALLWGAYLLDDKPLADAVLKRFDQQGLDKELRLIRSADHANGPTFEMAANGNSGRNFRSTTHSIRLRNSIAQGAASTAVRDHSRFLA